MIYTSAVWCCCLEYKANVLSGTMAYLVDGGIQCTAAPHPETSHTFLFLSLNLGPQMKLKFVKVLLQCQMLPAMRLLKGLPVALSGCEHSICQQASPSTLSNSILFGSFLHKITYFHMIT